MNVRVKICGLSEPATLEAALAAGADMVGLVFYPRSPRHVTLARARQLAETVGRRARKVVLTVDADDAFLAEIVAAVTPDFIQAHGSETPGRVTLITERFGVPVIKAVRVSGPDHVAQARRYDGVAEMVLFDAVPPRSAAALPGGNGNPFDWSLLAEHKSEAPFVLSGGLDPRNVGEAIRMTRAPIVDVSSGVETAPGRKDAALIRNFIEAARAAS